jgi:hypothetical protein
MDTLLIKSKSKSNAQSLMALAHELGDEVEINPIMKEDRTPAYHPLESAWMKDWLTPEEDEAWKDLQLLGNDIEQNPEQRADRIPNIHPFGSVWQSWLTPEVKEAWKDL